MLGAYSNRSELLEQLREAVSIMSEVRHNGRMRTRARSQPSTSRSRRLRDRFTTDERQRMIELFELGATRHAIAAEYGISVRSLARLLRERGVRRDTAPSI